MSKDKNKKNFFPTTQNLHQCTQIRKKKRLTRFSASSLPRSLAIFPKDIFSCHLAFFNKFHQMLDFKGIFVCFFWFLILMFNKFQPPSPVFTRIFQTSPSPKPSPPGTCILFRCCWKATSARSSVRARFCTSQPGTEAHTSGSGWVPGVVRATLDLCENSMVSH